ncbi:acyl-CoA dehydrogenase family protein (plasmid) [Streptomyces sp. FXJ1.172]|uniref:acyl-CoA dehydrogenase family protein n=1 Tax=Streptomyces sp. FXJ1.172 TaxID=710705 RepID=UPI0023DCF90D|nr:acyl-CoA dehydrogenase family protein [Streptomyces sp. FXJ1.172]WEP00883.1 acyl-CoA dehydrogenase family protein [Streptomyces sp. FXJ1.172]
MPHNPAAIDQDRAGSAPLHEAVRCSADLARALAPATEEQRSLPRELVDALIDSGLLRAGVPASLGGPEMPPVKVLQAAEAVARGDASAGWCTAISATTSLLSAYLPAQGAAEVFGDARSVASGVWAPTAEAKPVAGGVRVTGRWAFCSGVGHADWLIAGCVLADPDAVRGAAPVLRIAAMPTSDLEVLDTWRTSGLRGTGSHDVVADDVFVPAHRVASLVDGLPSDAAALHRFPLFGFFALSVAAAALGNARGALDDLVALASVRRPSGSNRTLAERSSAQAAVARAEASLRAARLLYFHSVAEAWEAARQPEPVSTELRVGLRLAATHAARTAAEVAAAMYDLGGGAAIYEDSPLQRRFRDAHTVTAHLQVNAATYEVTGRHLLGLPISTDRL